LGLGLGLGLSGIETAGLIHTYRAGRFSTGMGTCHDNKTMMTLTF
jgi:hypothetical protein